MTQDHPSRGDDEATSPAEDQERALENLRVLEDVLERGRQGASADWLKAAQDQVDDARVQWRKAARTLSAVD